MAPAPARLFAPARTDGEFRRSSWHMDFVYSLGGMRQVEGESIHVRFHSEEGEYDYASRLSEGKPVVGTAC